MVLFWLLGPQASGVRSLLETLRVCAQFSLYLVLRCLVNSLTPAFGKNITSLPCHNLSNLPSKHAIVLASTTQTGRLFHWSATTLWVKESDVLMATFLVDFVPVATGNWSLVHLKQTPWHSYVIYWVGYLEDLDHVSPIFSVSKCW